MRSNISKLIFLLLTIMSLNGFAQKSLIYTEPDRLYKKAYDLYSRGKYVAAQKEFQSYLQTASNKKSELAVNSAFYKAVCAFEVFNPDAEKMFNEFLVNHPEDQKVQQAYFYLGNLFYRKKSFKDAIAWYEKMNRFNLDEERGLEYDFKLGYSYFQTEQVDKAKPLLASVKDKDSKYSSAAGYYFAHINYSQKNYETALQEFLKLKENENFSPAVPYYITQIYYLQGKYDEVIAYAPALLDSANPKRAPEIARLIGEAYYKTQRYDKSLPFLEKYKSSSNKYSREDAYQLGYAYYKSKDFNNAIKSFNDVITKEQDTLTQFAYYYVGDSYVQLGNKKSARESYLKAAKFDFDPQLREDALFTGAKLSYELAFNPFNEAINAFENYIRQYPQSQRLDEAYRYLVNVYLATNNYKEALSSIEKIRNKTEDQKYAYQRIAYNRGVELYNQRDYNGALENFEKASQYPLDKSLNAQILYWKAESLYRVEKYQKAIEHYQAFVLEPGAINQPYFKTSWYNIGYSYYKLKDYPNAINGFRKFIDSNPENQSKKLNDAFLRTGDSYYVSKDYNQAVDFYNSAIKLKVFDTDYAYFHKGISEGLLGKNDEKIASLNQLLASYPKSSFSDNAIYEIGNAYLTKGDNEKAISFFKRIADEYASSPLLSKSLLKTALIYFNQDKNQEALTIYKNVISKYPSTPESREALGQVRNIYVEVGNMDEYTAYLSTVPNINISQSALDSTLFEAAELKYIKGDCPGSLKDFNSYIEKFPNGFFLLNVNFYRSECLFKQTSYDEALKGYNYVIEKPSNVFSEKALVRASFIQYKNKNCNEALPLFQQLERNAQQSENLIIARTGQMRCNLQNGNFAAAIQNAESLIMTTEKIQGELLTEAHFTKGRSALALGNDSVAMQEFQITAKQNKSDLGAESKYYIAEILHKRGDLKGSEKAIFEVANDYSNDYWIAKSFILLSDNYLAAKDNFQAKATLQSVIDNYEGEDLKAVAREKLNKIIEAEQLEIQKKAQEENEIRLNEKNDQQLFENENKGGSNE